MTDTITISLGYTSLQGSDAVTECNLFKMLMRSGIGRDPDGAWLKMVREDDKRIGMSVEYYPDIAGAYDWAKKAQTYAELVWEQAKGNQKPNEHIIARSGR